MSTITIPAPIDIIFIIRGRRLAGVEDIADPGIVCCVGRSRTVSDERSDDSCAPRTAGVHG